MKKKTKLVLMLVAFTQLAIFARAIEVWSGGTTEQMLDLNY
jgi:hypothetical protein